jgi:uncharacterized protein YegL
MRTDLTDIVFVLDRSGSMSSIKSEAIGGFNGFVEAQKKAPGAARLSLVLFDHEYQLAYDAVPLGEVQPLDASTYVPRGTTALLDAVGRAIDDTGNRLASTPEAERPGLVMVCILTDGHENASQDYTRERVKAMTQHQQQVYNWEFRYLGANQDAFAEASKLGVQQQHAASFAPTSSGARAAFSVMDSQVLASRRVLHEKHEESKKQKKKA